MTNEDLFEVNDDQTPEDSLTFDMESVEGGTHDLIPQGTYDCVIESVEFKYSQSSGKPMWQLALTITTGEYANRKLFTIISFSPAARAMAKATLLRIAPEVISSKFNPKDIADQGILVGKQVKAKTKIEEYEGNKRTNVKSLLAASAGDVFASM